MARSYDDEIHVRTSGEEPAAFVWHGRLHVVRDVLAHWYERRAWWAQADDGPRTGEAPGGGAVALADARAVAGPVLDREVWRVVAGAGRTAGTGVYELCHERPGDPGGWTLRSVDD